MSATEPTTRLAALPLRVTYEEYRDWGEFEGGLTEWVNGEVEFHMAPLDRHQRVVEFLNRLLDLFAQFFAPGLVRVAPFTVRVSLGGNAREPDIFYLAQNQLHRLTQHELSGPPDLVVEIISDESAYRDRDLKFYEYQDGGVREYWIIDPRPGKRRVDGYQLDLDGTYLPIAPDAERRYHSLVLPGFWLRPAWLWQEPPLDPLTALAEMRGLTPDVLQTIRALIRGEAT